MLFLGRQNAIKYVFGGGSVPDLLQGGAHSTPPDLLAALRNHTCKGRERRGKK